MPFLMKTPVITLADANKALFALIDGWVDPHIYVNVLHDDTKRSLTIVVKGRISSGMNEDVQEHDVDVADVFEQIDRCLETELSQTVMARFYQALPGMSVHYVHSSYPFNACVPYVRRFVTCN